MTTTKSVQHMYCIPQNFLSQQLYLSSGLDVSIEMRVDIVTQSSDTQAKALECDVIPIGTPMLMEL